MDNYEVSALPSFVQKVLSIGTLRALDRANERKSERSKAQAKKLINLLKLIDYEYNDKVDEDKYDLSPYPTWILELMNLGTMNELNRMEDLDDEMPEKARIITLLFRLRDEQRERPVPRTF